MLFQIGSGTDTWELRNGGVDIWEQLTLEHGLVASSTADKEQILTEWENFEGLPDEGFEAFRALLKKLLQSRC